MSFLPENPQLSPVNRAGYPESLLRLDYRSRVDGIEDWALLLPPTHRPQEWIVSIHGHDGHGNQLYIRSDIKRAWLPCYQAWGFGIVTPNLRNNAWMNPEAVEDMDALLEFLRQRFQAKKFYFCSGSMGATSNLIYGALRPDNVSGIITHDAVADLTAYLHFCRKNEQTVPLLKSVGDSIEASYGGSPEEKPELYRRHSPLFAAENLFGIPMYCIHGTADELMPVSLSRAFAGALANHPHFVYQEIPGANHNAPLSIPDGMPGIPNSPLHWITAL